MITVRRIEPDDAELLREMRLRALSDTPMAFGSTYAREFAFAPAEWQARAARNATAPDGATFIAFEDGLCCGLIGCIAKTDESGQATIVSMWVAPEARRKGVGRRLLQAAETWARKQKFLYLLLDVVENNAPAIALYKDFGFELTGETHPYPHDPNLRQLFMIKPISPAPTPEIAGNQD